MSEINKSVYILNIKKQDQSINPESTMHTATEFVAQISKIISEDEILKFGYFLNHHLNDCYHIDGSFEYLIEICTRLKPFISHKQDVYTLRRVVIASSDWYRESSDSGNKFVSYDISKISSGIIASSYRIHQSWTMKKNSQFLLQDRYESNVVDKYPCVMYMIEKTFSKDDIIIHIPSLVCALKDFGMKDLYDGFFEKDGLHKEEEVLVTSPLEVEFERLWFFQWKEKRNFRGMYKSTPYKKTSEVFRIPLVDGGYLQSPTIYFEQNPNMTSSTI